MIYFSYYISHRFALLSKKRKFPVTCHYCVTKIPNFVGITCHPFHGWDFPLWVTRPTSVVSVVKKNKNACLGSNHILGTRNGCSWIPGFFEIHTEYSVEIVKFNLTRYVVDIPFFPPGCRLGPWRITPYLNATFSFFFFLAMACSYIFLVYQLLEWFRKTAWSVSSTCWVSFFSFPQETTYYWTTNLVQPVLLPPIGVSEIQDPSKTRVPDLPLFF
jgi:hypothetical protein